MPIASSIYNSLFRRNHVFVGTVFASAFIFEMVFDQATEKLWDRLNKGKQWKDIRHKYANEE